MNHTKKLIVSLLTAGGIAISAPVLATDPSEVANDAGGVPSSVVSNDVTMVVTVAVPNLVFTEGAWYTYSNGTWQALNGAGEWIPAAQQTSGYDESATTSYESAVSDSAYYAAEDGTLYSYEDAQWYIWIPVEVALAPDLPYSAAAMSAAASSEPTATSYVVQAYDMDGSQSYSFDDGGWYVMLPIDEDIAPSYVVLLQ